jgi:hypothetical protein
MAHLGNENEKRDELLAFSEISDQSIDTWIAFFESIDGIDMGFESIEKARLLEKELRNKYKIFK